MRDQHDTQTSDLIPAKRGRPVLDVDRGPMSDAERARRYRQNRRTDAKSATKRAGTVAAPLLHEYSDAALLEAIRMAMHNEGRGYRPPSIQKKLAGLVAELARRYPVK